MATCLVIFYSGLAVTVVTVLGRISKASRVQKALFEVWNLEAVAVICCQQVFDT